MKKGHCSTCGEKLSPFDKREGFSWHDILQVERFRPLQEGRSEISPQLIAQAGVFRNGGGEDPVCDGCLLVGLERVRDKVNGLIEQLRPNVQLRRVEAAPGETP